MSYRDSYEHLIARNYDASYAVTRDPCGDIQFYRELARESGGPVLELGCGTGRILLPIARDGLECVGLDNSAAMLDVLREKSPPANLRVVEGRMESFDFGTQRFRLITCPFRAFSHLLDVDAQLAALARIRHHLAPGGLFAFDVFDPKLENLARLEEAEHLAITFRDGERVIRRWDTVRREPSRQVLTASLRYEGGPPELSGSAELQMRWFYRFELEHLLARSGFAELAFFRDFRREPWSSGRETVVLARADVR